MFRSDREEPDLVPEPARNPGRPRRNLAGSTRKRWSGWRNFPAGSLSHVTLNSRFGVVSTTVPGRANSNSTRSNAQASRVKLIHGSLMYRDKRLEGFDAAAVVEVVEHLDPPRLAAFERVLFEFARPRTVVLTTPNREYNVTWETLPAGQFRHADHRFEWTRQEFQAWANGSPTGSATRCGSCRSGRNTRSTARRRRWRCSVSSTARHGRDVN